MDKFNVIDTNFNSLSEAELQAVNGGGLLLIIGGVVVGGGIVLWGVYNGYQSAARGG